MKIIRSALLCSKLGVCYDLVKWVKIPSAEMGKCKLEELGNDVPFDELQRYLARILVVF